MRLILFYLSIVVFAACENTAQETRRFSQYFDVDSLINNQLEVLGKGEKTVYKVATLNSKTDTTSYIADSLQLAQELNVFRKANINKPAFDDLYEKEISISGDTRINRYTAKDEMEVRFVELTYKQNQLKQIEAYVVEDHWLYDSKRTLLLMLSNSKSGSSIEKFSIEGTQKMIFRDRVNFIVEGDIKDKMITSVE